MTGRIRHINHARGFGFLIAPGERADLMFFRRDCADIFDDLAANEIVHVLTVERNEPPERDVARRLVRQRHFRQDGERKPKYRMTNWKFIEGTGGRRVSQRKRDPQLTPIQRRA